ncbi:MAG: hypothetical protein RI988_2022 [Pseudomonadota bacterium]|jgi:hypothetical protein
MDKDELAALDRAATWVGKKPLVLECVENGVWQIRLIFGEGEKNCTAMRQWADAYRATAAEARSVPVETYQRDIALRDEAYAQLEAENAKLRTFAEAFARQPCSCGVMQGAITCAPCQARAALETDHG